tara:strand:- start:342 stop:596 length:255 start_codon:yes stop_codon:yes gene_type:complete
MSNHPIEIGLAIAISGLVAVIALLLAPRPTVELPVTRNRPRASMKLTRAELLALAQEHQIENAKWRARATKAEFVRALQLEVQS